MAYGPAGPTGYAQAAVNNMPNEMLYAQKMSQLQQFEAVERDKSAIEVAIDMLEEANKRAISLNERLSAIVSRAYGEPPISGHAGNKPQAVPAGSLGALRAVIDDIHERQTVLEGLVSRLTQIA